MDITELNDHDLLLRCFGPDRDGVLGWVDSKKEAGSLTGALDLCEQALSDSLYLPTGCPLGCETEGDSPVLADEWGVRLDADEVEHGERLEALQELVSRLQAHDEVEDDWEGWDCVEGWLGLTRGLLEAA